VTARGSAARVMRPPAVTRLGAWLEDLADPAGVLAEEHNSDRRRSYQSK